MVGLIDGSFNAMANGSAPLTEAERALREWEIPYQKQPDGTLLVPGDIKIAFNHLTELPDFSAVVVAGSFLCMYNALTSLKGAPRSVGKNFYCFGNHLTSLEYAPATVGGNFFCHNNQLPNLAGAPAAIGQIFMCGGNPLPSLEGAPQEFSELRSDFGTYQSWQEVPEELRTSPETKARAEKLEKDRVEQQVHDAIVLEHDVTVQKPFRFVHRA